ncbi:chemotaxis protein CheW [Thiohalobacter sp.]|uniref:chemotaxis protein CheW n=1 Tax=Thiohalobacter sp. TaxID=2025948 RepID=UPI002607FEFD|nr:chemotaxis protein CheW [Thiohalobacter sp.]
MNVIQDKVRSLMVPLAGSTLLVPNVAVAEVVGYSEPAPVSDAPDWVLGVMDWRGHRIPLISFEALRGEPVPALSAQARIAVLNTVTGDRRVPFYALVTAGIPRLLRVGADDVQSAGALEPATGELARVQVNGMPAVIPDLKRLEGLVTGYWKQAA